MRSYKMTVKIVHALEVIQIKKQCRHSGVISPGAFDLIYQELTKIAGVVKSGEFIS